MPAATTLLTTLTLLACTTVARAEIVRCRFTARITENGGARHFAIGDTISGTMSIDTRGRNQAPGTSRGAQYRSRPNNVVFDYGKLRFTGRGNGVFHVHQSRTARQEESIGLGVHALELPDGWEAPDGSVMAGISLQNLDPQGVITDRSIPTDPGQLLDRFAHRRFTLLFFSGVKFPGGSVDRAVVAGELTSLKLLHDADEQRD